MDRRKCDGRQIDVTADSRRILKMDIEDLKLCPCVPSYSPKTLRDLQIGEKYSWCTCGLAKNQPWCDDSCSGTTFKPLEWICDRRQSLFSICCCKYTKDPPFCDAVHTSLPLIYTKQVRECTRDHAIVFKLCERCGFKPS
jgi:CDGSH iron-sulfur domain-containing protein 3